jgi:hypothetical protein
MIGMSGTLAGMRFSALAMLQARLVATLIHSDSNNDLDRPCMIPLLRTSLRKRRGARLLDD